MADSYNDQDLYGDYTYEDGETPASLSALIATFRNLRVNSAMIENLAVQNQHVKDLNAEKITSGKIHTERLEISGLVNIVGNNKFENRSTEGWEYNLEQARSATDPVVTPGAPSDYVGQFIGRDTEYGAWFDVNPGEAFATSAWVCNVNSPHTFGVGLHFQTTTGDTWLIGASIPPENKVWTFKQGTLRAPSNATKARAFVQVDGFSDFGSWFATLFDIRRQGIIRADMLEANSVIAQDIIFKGRLEGATGTFSGDLSQIGPYSKVVSSGGTFKVEYTNRNTSDITKWESSMNGSEISVDYTQANGSGSKAYMNRFGYHMQDKFLGKFASVIMNGGRLQLQGDDGLILQGAVTMKGDGLELYRSGGAYIDFHHTDNGTDFDARIILTTNNELQFHMNGALRHAFRADGSKAGGSIEIDGENLGMSPIDSPQMPIEYVEFDIQLVPEGSKVSLDAKFVKSVEKFAVFQNNGDIVEKGNDYFIISGEGSADCRIIGLRKGYADMFWASMETA